MLKMLRTVDIFVVFTLKNIITLYDNDNVASAKFPVTQRVWQLTASLIKPGFIKIN